jgi:hypothetical protein
VLSPLSLLCLHQSLSSNGLRRTFPLLWVPELSPCLSYQFLTAAAHNDRIAVLWLLTNSPTLHFTALHCTAPTTSVRLLGWRPSPTDFLLLWLTPDHLTKFYICPAYNTSARIARKTFLIVVVHLLPWEHVYLRSRYSVTAFAYLLISRSLPSNGSTCYNMFYFPIGIRIQKLHWKYDLVTSWWWRESLHHQPIMTRIFLFVP